MTASLIRFQLNQLKNLLSGRTIQIVIETGHLSMVIAAIVTANALLIMFAMAAFLFHSDRRITSNTTSTSARILQNLALMLTGGGLLVAICALAVLILRNVQSPLQSWDLIPLAASPFLYAITYLSLLSVRVLFSGQAHSNSPGPWEQPSQLEPTERSYHRHRS